MKDQNDKLIDNPDFQDDESWSSDELFGADPDCVHIIKSKWSGVECIKCGAWFCY